MKKQLRILALFDSVEPKALDEDLSEEMKTDDRKSEADLLNALKMLGHDSDYLVIHDDMDLIRQKLDRFPADLIFNLADQFRNNRSMDQNIASFLELRGSPFTGCGSAALFLCKNKAISKKILSFHGIRVPAFAILPRGPIRSPRRLRFPLLVKPLKEEASLGIAQASFVENEDRFRERVEFIHNSFGQHAIAEEYIAGRELYVSLLGERRLEVYPIREMEFREVADGDPKIATYRAKWDEGYRERWGISNGFASGLDTEVSRRIARVCRRIYRLLLIDGYARIDLRLTPDNEIVFIEANPNPILSMDEDFAESASAAGIGYPALIQKIIRLGLRVTRE